MMKGNKKWLILAAILVIAATCTGGYVFWVVMPHQQAVARYENAVRDVRVKNNELEYHLGKSAAALEAREIPLDATTMEELQKMVEDFQDLPREIPPKPEKTQELNDIAALLEEPLDFSNALESLQQAYTDYTTSVSKMKQVTNPAEDFVLDRLSRIDSIVDKAAVTEDHDPNSQLHKSGGYTSAVFFEDSQVDEDSFARSDKKKDVIDKGTKAGGCIEVFANREDAEKRDSYLNNFDGSILASGSHTLLGTMIIRTSDELTASQQKELTARIQDAMIALE